MRIAYLEKPQSWENLVLGKKQAKIKDLNTNVLCINTGFKTSFYSPLKFKKGLTTIRLCLVVYCVRRNDAFFPLQKFLILITWK